MYGFDMPVRSAARVEICFVQCILIFQMLILEAVAHPFWGENCDCKNHLHDYSVDQGEVIQQYTILIIIMFYLKVSGVKCGDYGESLQQNKVIFQFHLFSLPLPPPYFIKLSTAVTL